jgi:hypothetical protein
VLPRPPEPGGGYPPPRLPQGHLVPGSLDTIEGGDGGICHSLVVPHILDLPSAGEDLLPASLTSSLALSTSVASSSSSYFLLLLLLLLVLRTSKDKGPLAGYS